MHHNRSQQIIKDQQQTKIDNILSKNRKHDIHILNAKGFFDSTLKIL